MSEIESIQTFTTEMIIKATEEIDNFMFEVMQPYCEQVSRHYIKKKDLEQALIRYFRKGHWISISYELDYEGDAKCSVCGKSFINILGENFCPNCGADMRGGANESCN